MVIQYPHTIKFTSVSGPSTQDGSGNWIPGASATVEKKCRFEPNARGAFIADVNGTNIIFDGTVYLPLPADTIAPGTAVEVLNGAEVLSKGSVKKFSRGQLNARLWL